MSALRFFDNLPDSIQKQALKRHDWLCLGYHLEQKVRYNLPFYYQKSWICYLDFTKTGRLELAFTSGNELSNTQQLLKSKGRKQVHSVDITDFSSIPNSAINEIVQETLRLDETVAYASKRN